MTRCAFHLSRRKIALCFVCPGARISKIQRLTYIRPVSTIARLSNVFFRETRSHFLAQEMAVGHNRQVIVPSRFRCFTRNTQDLSDKLWYQEPYRRKNIASYSDYDEYGDMKLFADAGVKRLARERDYTCTCGDCGLLFSSTQAHGSHGIFLRIPLWANEL